MKTIKYVEKENGARYIAETGKEMEIIEEISKEEFHEKFPDAIDVDDAEAYLENGNILLISEWNGEKYFSDGKILKPVYREDASYDSVDIVGYYEV